jgi:hypothetical protein
MMNANVHYAKIYQPCTSALVHSSTWAAVDDDVQNNRFNAVGNSGIVPSIGGTKEDIEQIKPGKEKKVEM